MNEKLENMSSEVSLDHLKALAAEATEEQFAEFVRLLDEPLPSTEKFDRLFSRRSRFADSE